MSVLRQLKADLVLPTWPLAGEAASVDVLALLDGDMLDDICDVWRCLLPESEWPSEPAVSRVHASDSEWYKVCTIAAQRGIFEKCDEHDIFIDVAGNKVLLGAMGVDKPKVQPGDGVLMLMRFICICCPVNAYFRKVRGDAHVLSYIGYATLILLDDEEELWMDSEDVTSCFNVFRMPDFWKRFFVFNKQVPQSAFGGDPNRMVWP